MLIGIRLGVTAQLDHLSEVWTSEFPDLSKSQPFVGDFDLPAVFDLLIEDTELVANSIADSRKSEGQASGFFLYRHQ